MCLWQDVRYCLDHASLILHFQRTRLGSSDSPEQGKGVRCTHGMTSEGQGERA